MRTEVTLQNGITRIGGPLGAEHSERPTIKSRFALPRFDDEADRESAELGLTDHEFEAYAQLEDAIHNFPMFSEVLPPCKENGSNTLSLFFAENSVFWKHFPHLDSVQITVVQRFDQVMVDQHNPSSWTIVLDRCWGEDQTAYLNAQLVSWLIWMTTGLAPELHSQLSQVLTQVSPDARGDFEYVYEELSLLQYKLSAVANEAQGADTQGFELHYNGTDLVI